MKDPLVTIIIPTWNNAEYLTSAVTSILRNLVAPGLFEVVIVNNGHPNSCDHFKGVKSVRVINAPHNLGWEGGIDLGLKNSSSPFVVFMNDDAMVPQVSRLWLNTLLQHMKDPKVGAVGPASNVVMGAQNIFQDVPFAVFASTFVIGFCVLIRRSAFEEIGGMDMSLPGGDDLDWSIRLRQAGYQVLVDRSVFIYHHGFKTGERLYGTPQARDGWNSYEKTHATNQALIKKHGLKVWWATMRGQILDRVSGELKPDSEGTKIRQLVKGSEKLVLDLGCGPHKTLRRAVGVDYVKRGERIPTLEGYASSDADIEADVSQGLPFEDSSVDVIIGRHILEHMVDPLTALIFWCKKLKPGGRLILALPNQDWYSTIPMNLEHVHAYTPSSASVLLSALGLHNIKIYDSHNNISFIIEGTK